MQLATKIDCPVESLLENWRWLLPGEVELVVIAKSGDAFVRQKSDGSIVWLDLVDGKIHRVAETLDEFQEAIQIKTNVEKWFRPEIVEGQSALGMEPGLNQCLSFKHPPVLGGEITPDNIEITDVEVHFSIMGQIHQQVKDMPAGTRIGSIKMAVPKPQKPWYRFW